MQDNAQKPKTVFLFSGQGSQYFQMGRELYDTEPEFRRQMDQMDTFLVALTGRSIVSNLYGTQTQAEPLDDVLISHPAIVMIELALAKTLIHAGVQPDLTLGCSLGSFAAAAISGFISVEEALALAVHQANIVQKHCSEGAMIAILADPSIYQTDALKHHSVIAAYNFSTHFIITTLSTHVPIIEAFIKEQNYNAQHLPVRVPFHSPWLDSAKNAFLDESPPWRNQAKHLPMWCCANGTTVDTLPVDYFWTVVREPIQFIATITQLEQQAPLRYLDLGPSGTLATFLKYLLPSNSSSTVMATLTRFGHDQRNLAAVFA